MKNILLCAALVISGNVYANRVEVPVYLDEDGKHFRIEVRVGSGPPIPVMIDTGAAGLRVFERLTGKLDAVKTGSTDKIMYGKGVTGLSGEVAKGTISIGAFRIPGDTKFQVVNKRICKPEAQSVCDRYGDLPRYNSQGTLGLSIASLSNNPDREVKNPLTNNAVQAYILDAPSAVGDVGRLIINPTAAEQAPFKRIALSGPGQRIPVCVKSECFTTILDTGTTGSRIQGNFPTEDGQIVSGTPVELKFGSGAGAFVYSTKAGPTGTHKMMAGGSRPVVGVEFYKHVRVLYDQKRREIGLAAKGNHHGR